MYKYIYIYAHYIHIYIYMHITYIYICTLHIYIYIGICIHAHAHTHTFWLFFSSFSVFSHTEDACAHARCCSCWRLLTCYMAIWSSWKRPWRCHRRRLIFLVWSLKGVGNPNKRRKGGNTCKIQCYFLRTLWLFAFSWFFFWFFGAQLAAHFAVDSPKKYEAQWVIGFDAHFLQYSSILFDPSAFHSLETEILLDLLPIGPSLAVWMETTSQGVPAFSSLAVIERGCFILAGDPAASAYLAEKARCCRSFL